MDFQSSFSIFLQNLALAENSPGSDGCEYHLVCIVSCNNIKATIPPFKIPFLFYNGMLGCL